MPPTKGNFRNYSEENLIKAVNEVLLHKMPMREAAKTFGVPRTTLKYKVEGKVPMERKMGPPSILTKAEEKAICEWILKMAAAGFPVTVEQLVTSVKKAIREVKRPNPFKDGMPGKTWVRAFLKRNQEISKRVSQNLTTSRAAVTSGNILNWFSEVHQYLQENDIEFILKDATRIFNSDESAFFLNPKGNKVLAKKGEKTVYQQVNADDKECITVLVTASASGLVAPTTVLYKYKRVPQDIVENFPKEWGIGKTDSGWMTCEAFFEFIADVFYPWLIEKQITLPIILFIDGHSSHLSLQTSKFCDSHGIVLVALYPNATHLLQPMDVAVFRTLKEGWRDKVHDWRLSNLDAPTLKKKDFPKLLKEVIDERVTKDILSNGFRKCGLFPWNPSAVQIPGEEEVNTNSNKNSKTHQARIKFLQEGLKFLNETVERDKIESFQRSADTWEGDLKDSSLFSLWKKTRNELESYNGNGVDENNSSDPASEKALYVTDLDNDSILPSELILQAEEMLNDINMLLDDTHSCDDINSSIPSAAVQAFQSSPIPFDGNLTLPTVTASSASFSPISCDRNSTLPAVIESSASFSPIPFDENSTLPAVAASSASFSPIPSDGTSTLPEVKAQQASSQKIPSPFKRHFFYENKGATIKKRRQSKEKLPTVVSGKQFHEYMEKKIAKKEEEETLKKERALERQRKKELRDEEKSKKQRSKKVKKVESGSESSSDSDASSQEMSDETRNEQNNNNFQPVEKKIDEFVMFLYENSYYPGKIICATTKEATITSMERCGKWWKWPKKPDVLSYEWKDVVAKICEPKKTSTTRNLYKVPELDFFWV